jgi:hypothetical protein
MHTTATPAAGSPNPVSGVIVVKLAQNFQRYLGGFTGQVSPVTGSAIVLSSGTLVQGTPYVITSLDPSTTAASWVAAGLPVGYSAAVGASFIASAAAAVGTGLGNATVKAVATSNIDQIEVIGDTNLTIGGQAPSGPTGAQLILQTLNPSGVRAAPTDGSVMSLSFYLSDSAVTVAGQ